MVEGADTTGLVMLGYQQRRPWIWVVDIDARSSGPTATRLPGNETAVSAVVARDGWYAVHTWGHVWSVPKGLDRPGVRIACSYTFVPRFGGDAVWVDHSPAVRHSSELVAVKSGGDVVDRVCLPTDWRLVADTQFGLVARDAEGCLHIVSPSLDTRRSIGGDPAGWVVAVGPAHLAMQHDESPELILASLETGETRVMGVEGVAAWQSSGTFSPDGRYLAVGGYPELEPPDERPFTEMLDSPYVGRRAVMAVVDTVTGAVTVADGEYDNFAWAPAWSRAGDQLVFGAPYQGRRLYSLRLDEMALRTLKFRTAPVMPMLDVTGGVRQTDSGVWIGVERQ